MTQTPVDTLNTAESLRQFVEGVRDGDIRGDSYTEDITYTVSVELSVGSFRYGQIHLRVFVEEPEYTSQPEAYYRRLFAVDGSYAKLRQEIIDQIEPVCDITTSNSHEWQQPDPLRTNYPFVPEHLDADNTHIFEDYVKVRQHVALLELIETNRSN